MPFPVPGSRSPLAVPVFSAPRPSWPGALASTGVVGASGSRAGSARALATDGLTGLLFPRTQGRRALPAVFTTLVGSAAGCGGTSSTARQRF